MIVTELIVLKWDAKELCVKNAELEIKKDWKAVAIISKEIASCPSLDLKACYKISKSTQSKLTGEKSKRRKRDVLEEQLAVLDQIVKMDWKSSEFRALIAQVKDSNPDLILFVGDYIENPRDIVDITTHRQNVIDVIKLIDPIPNAIVLGN